VRLLLDTHALLWFDAGDANLSARAREMIEDRSNEVYISHASAWEVAVKVSLGKLTLRVEYAALFPGFAVVNDFAVLAPTFDHYHTLTVLPFHHRDPFDRLLVAQAKVEGLTLVTRDANLGRYGVDVAW
jgi:PIN domain nuclease of toxin-antitoxin system